MRDTRQFLDTVGRQIRWKRARGPLLDELEAHITDRKDGLEADGFDPEYASAQAVREMGDPEEIGIALDRVHRPRPNWLLLGGAAILLLGGMALMWLLGDRDTYFRPMLIYAVLGLAAMITGYFLDYTALTKIPAWVILSVCGVLMVFPMIGNHLMTLAGQLCHMLPVLLVPLVYRARGGEKKDIAVMLSALIACQLAAAFSHQWMSLCIYITVVCSGIVIFAAAKGWFGKAAAKALVGSFAPFTIFIAFLAISSGNEFLSQRLDGVLHPERDPFGMGWIALRVRELIGTSQFVGTGETSELMESFLLSGELCSVDHLLAVAVHEYGWIVLVLLGAVAIFITALFIRGISRQSSGFASLTLLCIGLCFALRTVGYLICNLGFTLIYFEGLPLFSYCGKLAVLDMFMLGIALSVFRMESISRDSRIAAHRPSAG